MVKRVLLIACVFGFCASAQESPERALKGELGTKGWIAYGARAETHGTWDIFLSRPDGSQRRNITNTPDYEEATPRFSSDGTRLLYRRLEKGAVIDHDRSGFQGSLVVANADGSDATVFGKEGEYSWASWFLDDSQIACLTMKGIQFIDLQTKRVVRELPRKRVYQQLTGSPDGKWLCGVANHQGVSWTVVRLNAQSGALNAVRSFQNCTPDWHPDSERIILSSRPDGQPANDGYGFTQLWLVNGDGGGGRLIYGEDGLHVYGGCLSPDGEYVVFTKSPMDGSGAEESGGQVGIMRMADAPTIGGKSRDLREVHPVTADGPVVYIGKGWEPHWTYTDIGATE